MQENNIRYILINESMKCKSYKKTCGNYIWSIDKILKMSHHFNFLII